MAQDTSQTPPLYRMDEEEADTRCRFANGISNFQGGASFRDDPLLLTKGATNRPSPPGPIARPSATLGVPSIGSSTYLSLSSLPASSQAMLSPRQGGGGYPNIMAAKTPSQRQVFVGATSSQSLNPTIATQGSHSTAWSSSPSRQSSHALQAPSASPVRRMASLQRMTTPRLRSSRQGSPTVQVRTSKPDSSVVRSSSKDETGMLRIEVEHLQSALCDTERALEVEKASSTSLRNEIEKLYSQLENAIAEGEQHRVEAKNLSHELQRLAAGTAKKTEQSADLLHKIQERGERVDKGMRDAHAHISLWKEGNAEPDPEMSNKSQTRTGRSTCMENLKSESVTANERREDQKVHECVSTRSELGQSDTKINVAKQTTAPDSLAHAYLKKSLTHQRESKSHVQVDNAANDEIEARLSDFLRGYEIGWNDRSDAAQHEVSAATAATAAYVSDGKKPSRQFVAVDRRSLEERKPGSPKKLRSNSSQSKRLGR